MALSQEYIEHLRADQLEMKDMPEAFETGKIHSGNPWEGRTEAKMHDLRRKIAEHQLLIEKHDAKTAQAGTELGQEGKSFIPEVLAKSLAEKRNRRGDKAI